MLNKDESIKVKGCIFKLRTAIHCTTMNKEDLELVNVVIKELEEMITK
ncbi:MAG: hypothetical protein ACRCXT_03720 [Paraclostridium sp.]